MTNVTMKASDTLHISEVKAGAIFTDEEFVVSSHTAEELEKRGLATRVGDAPEQTKAEPPVLNKMEPAPANKGKAKS